MLLLISMAAATPLGDDQFIDFLSVYPKMAPHQVIADLGAMTAEQLSTLTVFESLGVNVYTHACHISDSKEATGSRDLVFSSTAGPMNCADLLAVEQTDVDWGMTIGAVRYAETQRLQVIQSFSCILGWLDQSECGTSEVLALD